jgi:hypothetical protein
VKREPIGSVIKGVDKLFVTEEKVTPITVTSPQPTTDTVEVAVTSPNTSPIPSPQPSTVTVTDTVTSPLIKPSEILHRMIGYYTSEQRKFIKGKAKKYNVTEAEIMRIAVEELMKSGKI